MANIADKFGKASTNTTFAIATTVKTARTAGATVLEAFDLSKYAIDTPVYFVTYKKTTDPVTNKVSITNQTSWKALVNPDNNTLTNMIVAPGYVDIGNVVGDYIECIPTSFWGNSLIDGISVSLNPDGTLKTSAVQAALNIGSTPVDWIPLAVVPSVIANNGQKEHVLRYVGVDYTDRYQPGTKLRIPRTGTTPTTSMSFVSASSQYASKTSPTGIAFTDNFTLEATINPSSYGGSMAIMGRMDATQANGFMMRLSATGQIEVVGQNAGAGNYRVGSTYRSVSLTKNTHVAATWATGVLTFYVDGVAIPSYQTPGGTNPTTIAQGTGDLAIGRPGSVAVQYFNGNIVNARIWSTVRTAAQIRDNMNQETPTSTTGLVAHFKGNGSWNDSSTNANHLTAAGGAVNNFASHPYSAVEYAIITKVNYTASNTDVTVFTGNGCLPNETLGGTSYSSARTPFGFPADVGEWKIESYLPSGQQAAPTGSVWYNVGSHQLSVPTGAWIATIEGNMSFSESGGTLSSVSTTLSKVNNAEDNKMFTSDAKLNAAAGAASNTNLDIPFSKTDNISNPTAQTYYLNVSSGGLATPLLDIGTSRAVIKVKSAYL